jgi:inner membrane protein
MENLSQPSFNLLDRFNRWIQESVMVKLFSIGVLVLVLLIPTVWIDNLINERQLRANEVADEVADKWSGSQLLSGPMLVLPYFKESVVDHGPNSHELVTTLEKAYFLPEQFDVTGTVAPEIRHRGIFDVVVYESAMKMKAVFRKPDLKLLSIPAEDVVWRDATLVFGISDLRGITDNPLITLDDSTYTPDPSNDTGIAVWQKFDPTIPTTDYGKAKSSAGLSVKLGWTNANDFEGHFSMDLKLKGSRRLDFLPAGKTTTVQLAGTWQDPSFDGYLPGASEVTGSGFKANWKILHFNRPFPQQWTGEDQQFHDATFGVRLIMPVDQYQKSTRTAKYGILVVLLTFMAFFLVEITQKVRIHPFQYILVGAALVIYYILLLSFSEHFGYNVAYTIASVATVILVGLYAGTFLERRLAVLVTLLLAVFYGFIFVIILQQDFSLLLGSVGLFLIVGMLMYFSRKINWYRSSEVRGA